MSHSNIAPREIPLPKVLVADDHHLILDALRAVMGSEFNVLGVDNSEAFISAVDRFQPDVAILDVTMPGCDSFVAARQVLERQPSLRLMFLSMHQDSAYVDRAAQVGAKAYLSKKVPAEELLSTIHAVLDGGSFLPQTQAEPIAKDDLTARQKEVLRLIARGYSAKDIANELNISVRTAEFHRAAIMQRLNLHSTAQMTRYAIANGLG